MPKVHGRNAVFTVTDINGDERDLSSWLTNIDHPGTVDNAEVSGFGQLDKSYVVGLRGHTIRIQGQWDGDANGPDDVLSGLAGQGANGTVITTYKWGPAGSVATYPKYSGTCVLTSYNPTSPLTSFVGFNADFLVNGSVTRGTW